MNATGREKRKHKGTVVTKAHNRPNFTTIKPQGEITAPCGYLFLFCRSHSSFHTPRVIIGRAKKRANAQQRLP